MGKIMKPNKVVLVLNGKYAGRKAIILKNYDEGVKARAYGHALVAGIDRYPKPVKRRMGKKKRSLRCRIKPFVKIYNYNHLMPTRYTVDLQCEEKTSGSLTDAQRRKIRTHLKSKMEGQYKEGKHPWFFSKLRF